MNKMEISRLITYIAGVAAGVACVIIGALRGDMDLIVAGVPLIGVSSLAGANVRREPIIEEVPVIGYADTGAIATIPEQQGKHAREE